MDLRRPLGVEGRGDAGGWRKCRVERLVDQASLNAPTPSFGQIGGGDPIGMSENFARQSLIIGERAPLADR